MRLLLMIAGLSVMAQAVAQEAPKKDISGPDESLPPRYATKYCELAAAVALPRVPGLEVIGTQVRDLLREKPGGALKRPEYSYSMTIELTVRALGRTERFVVHCSYDHERGARTSQPQVLL